MGVAMTLPSGNRGFTLVELMVVIVLVGLIMGMGTAFFQFSKTRYAMEANANQVQATLQATRSQAMTQNSPAYVQVRKRNGQVQVLSEQTMGRWEFEEVQNGKLPGALQKPLSVAIDSSGGNPNILVPGRLGNAIHLKDKKTAYRDALSYLSPSQGLVLRFWLRVKDVPGKSVLFAQAGEFAFGFDDDGRFTSSVKDVVVKSEDRVSTRQWVFVRVLYFRNALLLYVNGNRVGSQTIPEDRELQFRNDAKKFIMGSSSDSENEILLDSLEVSALLPRTVHTLPAQIKFNEDAFVKFNRDGTSSGGTIEFYRLKRKKAVRLRVLTTGIIERETWTRDIEKEEDEENKEEEEKTKEEEGSSANKGVE